MTLKEILAKLDIVERRMVQGVRDNMKIQILRLELFADGSGSIEADWSSYHAGMCKEEALLHQIFSTPDAMFEFEKIEDLEQWLNERAGDA